MEHDQAWQHLSPSLLYVSPWTRATGAKLRTENGNDTMQSFSSCSLWNPALHLIFYSRLQVIRSQSQKKKKKKELTVSVCSSDATLKMKRGAMLPPALVGRNLVGQGQGLLCPRGRRCSLLSAPDVLGGQRGLEDFCSTVGTKQFY